MNFESDVCKTCLESVQFQFSALSLYSYIKNALIFSLWSSFNIDLSCEHILFSTSFTESDNQFSDTFKISLTLVWLLNHHQDPPPPV